LFGGSGETGYRDVIFKAFLFLQGLDKITNVEVIDSKVLTS